jgi:hypothetical protein
VAVSAGEQPQSGDDARTEIVHIPLSPLSFDCSSQVWEKGSRTDRVQRRGHCLHDCGHNLSLDLTATDDVDDDGEAANGSEVTSVTSTVQTLVLDLSDLMVVRGY